MARKILIVDDNAINRQMLINALDRDYDTIEAENGREALALMHKSYKILSAVLLDIMMPVMDGYEVLRSVRDNALLSQIPIIMVTGAEDEDSRVKALSLGANDFISKPFNPDIVKHCLRNNIALRETASILNAIQKDKLTGLYNREAFFEKVSSTIKYRDEGGYILSCFDIDNFKLINDQYGAVEGDRILKEIGSVIKQNIEKIGGIAARISADNFAALFPAEHKNANLLQFVHEKVLASSEQRPVVFSVGRYVISDLSLPASAIYDRAYIAKQSVKGRYDKHTAYFDENMLQKLVRDQQMVSEMEGALSGKQFELWFQPQYNHVNGRLTGAEALVRWRHPQKGIIPPGEFIPLFEQNGFVYELDKYVWREACRYLRKWINEGLSPLPISVNISRYDIFRADLIETISGIVSEFNIPIDLLRLEITESAFAKSTQLIVDIVKKLLELGFTIEIDDFGSGYSSLNTLKSVPAQVVKLDMRFLDDGDDSQRGGNILESIVRMTKWLGMAVVAEGVETREQGDFLKSIGCSHVQGYLYAEPMPAAEYESHFRDAQREDNLQRLETTEHFNNNLFWNPKSMDSLIFNSFVGSACILEYYNGRIELIRVTDKFAQMLGGKAMTVDALLRLNIMDYLDNAVSRATIAELETATISMGEVNGELLFQGLPDSRQDLYVRSVMRIVASADNRHLVYCLSTDITAQRKSERNERRATQQLRALMENLPCGFTATSVADGLKTLIQTNDKFYELLGYTEEQFAAELNKDVSAAILPDDRQQVLEMMARTLSSDEQSSIEYRMVCRDGSTKWIRSRLSATTFEDSGEKVFLCTYVDITKEKNATHSLLDNLPCGVGICVFTEHDIRMDYLNKRFFSYFKHKTGMGDGSIFEKIHQDDVPALRKALIPARQKGSEGFCVVRIRDGDGIYVPFRVTGVAMEADSGDNSIYVTFVPISQEGLSTAETLSVALEKVMEASTELSFVKDKDLRYICCSRSFAHMVGLENEKDVAGKTDAELFDAEIAARYVADDRKLMESGQSIVDMVEKLPPEDGRDRYSSTSKYLLYDSNGSIIGLYGSGRDITHSRELESRQEFLLNNIPGGVAIFEGVWSSLESINLIYFSDGYCRLFGYTREEYEKLGSKNPTGLVEQEYIAGLVEQIEALVRTGAPLDYIYRARHNGGGYRWIHVKGTRGEMNGEKMTVNAVLFDVTEHQEALERLRVSEEENRLAIRHSDNVVCRYDVASRTLKVASGADPIFELGDICGNVPYAQVNAGNISPETVNAYIELYESIMKGEKSGSAIYQRRSTHGWRWLSARFSTIFSRSGAPISAVISFKDVTESFEKEAAYKKWRQSLQTREPRTYSLYRCNLSKRSMTDTPEGMLLSVWDGADTQSFPAYVNKYADNFVCEKDKADFRAYLDADGMLEKYYRGEHFPALEYRERLPDKKYRWLRLTVDLVEYPHSSDVEAYLLFEDIDAEKRAELLTSARAQSDSLTGVYNRATFAENVNEIIRTSGAGSMHALLMLDIDNFKCVNDVFGHAAGDQTLIDTARTLKTVLRRDDLVGRLGGDEFVIFLRDISADRVALNKAKRICELSRRDLGDDVRISASVGIAVCPADGEGFEALYKKADAALYYVKGMGRDSYAMFRDNMSEDAEPEPADEKQKPAKLSERKRRMLIVDDNKLDIEMLTNMFAEEYTVDRARDGESALVRLRHYGTAVSVVLLDLIMPGINGFEVLKKMQQNPELRSIPVVVVSGADDRETSLRAIRDGASDFVMKPVDPEVLRIRVHSAVTKAENDRQRAKTDLQELQTAESQLYKAVLNKIGLAVAELDWGKGSFTYSPSVSEALSGKYDSRTLWHILMTDMVADTETVRGLQQLVHDVAGDRSKMEGSMVARLKTPSGKTHRFTVSVFKKKNDYGLTDKMTLTFKDEDKEQQ